MLLLNNMFFFLSQLKLRHGLRPAWPTREQSSQGWKDCLLCPKRITSLEVKDLLIFKESTFFLDKEETLVSNAGWVAKNPVTVAKHFVFMFSKGTVLILDIHCHRVKAGPQGYAILILS